MLANWSLTEITAQLLEREEREAVLGDLEEAGEGPWLRLLDVLGLVIRRQASLWRSWRPWIAAFGVAFPCSFLLMGVSVSISSAYQKLFSSGIWNETSLTARNGLLLLLCHVLLLLAWSWSSGFIVGALSRRTLWVSMILTCCPCFFCFSRFRIESLSRFCLFLFLLPAIWGVCRGMRVMNLRWRSAVFLVIVVTMLMIYASSVRDLWIMNWILLWPVWYLAVTARRPHKEKESTTG